MLTRTPVPARFDGHRLRDAFDRVLAADIHCCGRAADLAVRRRDVDDAAFALPKHRPNLVLHAQKHTNHIRVENGLIALGGQSPPLLVELKLLSKHQPAFS